MSFTTLFFLLWDRRCSTDVYAAVVQALTVSQIFSDHFQNWQKSSTFS